MSTILYVENLIVGADDPEPVITGSGKDYAGIGAVSDYSTNKLFRWALYDGTPSCPRQLWEFKFKINSSKITNSHVGYIIDYDSSFCIPQMLINTDGELCIFILDNGLQMIDPATGLKLWKDPNDSTKTTITPPFTQDGNIDMSLAYKSYSYSKYKVTLAKDTYYTCRIILDHTSHYATVILNNTVIAMQSVMDPIDTSPNQFRNCEFLDVDYFTLIDLNGNDQSGSTPVPQTFNVVKSTESVDTGAPIQDGVM